MNQVLLYVGSTFTNTNFWNKLAWNLINLGPASPVCVRRRRLTTWWTWITHQPPLEVKMSELSQYRNLPAHSKELTTHIEKKIQVYYDDIVLLMEAYHRPLSEPKWTKIYLAAEDVIVSEQVKIWRLCVDPYVYNIDRITNKLSRQPTIRHMPPFRLQMSENGVDHTYAWWTHTPKLTSQTTSLHLYWTAVSSDVAGLTNFVQHFSTPRVNFEYWIDLSTKHLRRVR